MWCPFLIIKVCNVCFCTLLFVVLQKVWPTELLFRLVRQSRSVYPRVIGSWSLTHVLNLFIFTPEGSLNEFIHYSQQIWVMSSWNNKVRLRFSALTINKRINVMVDLGRYFLMVPSVLFVGCTSISSIKYFLMILRFLFQ